MKQVDIYQTKIQEFYSIIEKFKKEILQYKNKLQIYGVEDVIKKIFEYIEESLAFEDLQANNKEYENFESMFKFIFFNYIWNLQKELIQQIPKLNTIYLNYKKKIKSYLKVITLNYDTILEKWLGDKNKKDVYHLHDSINEMEDGTINFSKCLLDTIRKPKNKEIIPQLSLFINKEKYKNKFELDIVGLNPINDENIFALLINSEVCNSVTFYYHQESDLENFEIVLKKISDLWVEKTYNNQVFLQNLEHEKLKKFSYLKNSKLNYKLSFNKKWHIVDDPDEFYVKSNNNHLIIKLIHSKYFWGECKKKKTLLEKILTETDLKNHITDDLKNKLKLKNEGI